MIPAAHIVGLAMLIGIWSANQITELKLSLSFIRTLFAEGDIHLFAVSLVCGAIVWGVVLAMFVSWLIWLEDGRGRRSYNEALINVTNTFFLQRLFPTASVRRLALENGFLRDSGFQIVTPRRRRLLWVLVLFATGGAVYMFPQSNLGLLLSLVPMLAATALLVATGWQTRHGDTMLNHVVDGGLRFGIYAAAMRAYLTFDGVTASDALRLLMPIALWWLVVWLKSAPERIDRRLDVF